MQRIDLKESDWRSSIAKAKAMDWLIRHRVAGKSSVEVDNYVEKLCTHSCEVERHPGRIVSKIRVSASIPITGVIAWLQLLLVSPSSGHCTCISKCCSFACVNAGKQATEIGRRPASQTSVLAITILLLK
jgi:hypothetical protein